MKTRFILDGMLGALARWLRICGYDTEYINNTPDEELIRRAADERRALLTRDRMLYRKAIKMGADALLVEGRSDVEKLASVSRGFDLELDPTRSRCPQCNGLLITVDKEAVRDKVSHRTFEAYNEFWVCRSCGKVYWRGSHWNNIVETVKAAKRVSSSIEDGGQPL